MTNEVMRSNYSACSIMVFQMYKYHDFFNIVKWLHLLAAWKCYFLDVSLKREKIIFNSVGRSRNLYTVFRKEKKKKYSIFTNSILFTKPQAILECWNITDCTLGFKIESQPILNCRSIPCIIIITICSVILFPVIKSVSLWQMRGAFIIIYKFYLTLLNQKELLVMNRQE